jgi:heavy metal sensor kinase
VRLPIRARLAAWTTALVAGVIGVLGIFLPLRLRAELVRGIDQGLETRVAQISLGLRSGCEGEFRDVSDASLVGLPRGEAGAQLLSADGAVQESSGDVISRRGLVSGDSLVAAFSGQSVRRTVIIGPDAEAFRILAIRLPGTACRAVVVVATSLDQVEHSVHQLVMLLLVAGPAMVAVAAGGGWWLAGRGLAPVARMTREAQDVAVDNLSDRIDVPRTTDELQRLAVTLNTMLDRLHRGLEEKRRFVSDASHELRTPLSVMRSEIDVALLRQDLDPSARDALESIREEAERMSAIVENLLTLARIDEGELRLLREPVDLRDISTAAVASLTPLARTKGVRVEVTGDRARAIADRARLEQVMRNLISNAVKFSPSGGRVSVSSWSTGGEVGCTVRDDGPGIPSEALPTIFERFVRADAARHDPDGGSGLGLAISREIVNAHGGRIQVDSRSGRGSSFWFTLSRDAGDTTDPRARDATRVVGPQ